MKTPDQGEHWGILGGTFDPIHLGHFCLASDIQRIKNLDGILFVPSFSHPFKNEQSIISFEYRVAMVKLAIASHEAFAVSTLEKDNNLSGYTLDTIKTIKETYPKTTFFFLIGADNITQVPLWHNASQIVQEIKIIAGKRPPFEMPILENDFSESIEYIDSGEFQISSTDIKSLILNKEFEKLRTILHPDVLQYIKERNLYI